MRKSLIPDYPNGGRIRIHNWQSWTDPITGTRIEGPKEVIDVYERAFAEGNKKFAEDNQPF